MSFFLNIKHKLANTVISRKLKNHPRKKEFFNLETAKTIGIFFDTLVEKNYSTVKLFSEELSRKGYQVKTIGWVNADNLPDYGVAQKIILYTNQDIKWSGEPKIQELKDFINQKFDLLFILTNSEHLSVQYISKLSMAKCKVGAYNANFEYLDLMIEQTKNKSLDNLISESLNYLTQIKK